MLLDFQQIMASVDKFCAEYWYGGPILLCLWSLISGMVSRSRRSAIGRQAAAQLQKEATSAIQVKVETPAEKLAKLFRDAIALGVTYWDLKVEDKIDTYTCTAPNYKQLKFTYEKTGTNPKFLVNNEDFTSTIADISINGRSVRGDSSTLRTKKQEHLEEIRIGKILNTMDPTLSIPGINVPNQLGIIPNLLPTTHGITAPAPLPLHPNDLQMGEQIYKELLRTLTPNRFIGCVNGDIHQMTDNVSMTFKVYGPDEVEVWVSGVTPMPLMTREQKAHIAKICYNLVTEWKERNTYLTQVLTTLKKLI